jgi:hypothetical protein
MSPNFKNAHSSISERETHPFFAERRSSTSGLADYKKSGPGRRPCLRAVQGQSGVATGDRLTNFKKSWIKTLHCDTAVSRGGNSWEVMGLLRKNFAVESAHCIPFNGRNRKGNLQLKRRFFHESSNNSTARHQLS